MTYEEEIQIINSFFPGFYNLKRDFKDLQKSYAKDLNQLKDLAFKHKDPEVQDLAMVITHILDGRKERGLMVRYFDLLQPNPPDKRLRDALKVALLAEEALFEVAGHIVKATTNALDALEVMQQYSNEPKEIQDNIDDALKTAEHLGAVLYSGGSLLRDDFDKVFQEMKDAFSVLEHAMRLYEVPLFFSYSGEVTMRRFQAEDLTHGWLVKVKRGWLSIVDSGSDLDKTMERLRRFLRNLVDQVTFQVQGFQTRFPQFHEEIGLTAAVDKVLKKLDAAQKTYVDLVSFAKEKENEMWSAREIESRSYGVSWPELLQMKGGKEAFQKVNAWDALNEEAVEKAYGPVNDARDNPDKFLASVTRAFEGVMKILYADARDLAKARETGTVIPPTEMAKEFDLYGMKVIIADPTITPMRAQEYLKRFEEAYAALKQKRLLSPWGRGIFFIDSKEVDWLSEGMIAAYARLGYKNMRARAGRYHTNSDVIVITNPPNRDLVKVLIHELGHRYWYRVMKSEQRARFNGLVQTNRSEESFDYPSGPEENGKLKPVTPVSDYGKSSVEEAFAEAWTHYVLGFDMNRDQVDSFRSVLASSYLEYDFSLDVLNTNKRSRYNHTQGFRF